MEWISMVTKLGALSHAKSFENNLNSRALDGHRLASLHGFTTIHLAGVMPRPSMMISRALWPPVYGTTRSATFLRQ